jgi:predicted nuclease of predicted toxin-antitoxin system
MKFLVDAQLPRVLAKFLCDKGHDAIHTLELPNGNDTTDSEINRISLDERRVVISKDGDFHDSFTATREPYKLLRIKIGNSRNADLISLFSKNLDPIIAELESGSVVEVTRLYIIKIQ